MPKLNNFFDKTETVEKILTKKMHPQLVSINKLEESKLQYRDIPQEDVEKLADLIELDGEVLQPLLVRKAGGDTYEILAGSQKIQSMQISDRKRIGTVFNDSLLCKSLCLMHRQSSPYTVLTDITVKLTTKSCVK